MVNAAKAAEYLDKSGSANDAFKLAEQTNKTKALEYEAQIKEREIQKVQIENEERRKTVEYETQMAKRSAEYKVQMEAQRDQ